MPPAPDPTVPPARETILRRIAPADWAAFRAIRLEMLTQVPEAYGSSAEEFAEKTEADLRQWLTDIHMIGVWNGDDLIACAGFYAQPHTRMAHRANVISVYTRPAHRGAGLNGRLMDAVADAALLAGIDQLELQVLAENITAIASYHKAGFTIAGTIPRAIRIDGVDHDDHLMVRDLRGAPASGAG